MSTRRLRRGALLAAALAFGTIPATAAAQPPSPGSTAADTVHACVQRAQHLLVYVQIDRSGSIRTTDRYARRVGGVTAALYALSELTQAHYGEQPVKVDVLLGSFAGDVEPTEAQALSRWVPLDDRRLEQLRDDAEDYASRNHDKDTDYVLAMQAADRALHDKADLVRATEHVMPCQVLLFLTDGQYLLTQRSRGSGLPTSVRYARDIRLDGGPPRELHDRLAAAMGRGRVLLCGERDGSGESGLMDEMVHQGIVKFTVALSRSDKPGSHLFDYLHALTTGDWPPEHCGRDLSEATGRFIPVHDLTSLFITFRDILDPGCGDGCATGQRSFVAEPGLRGFRFTAEADRDRLTVTVTTPTHKTVPLADGDETTPSLPGVTLTPRWSELNAVDLLGRFATDSRAWQGRWSFTVSASTQRLDPKAYGLRLRTDLRPTLVAKPRELVPGHRTTIRLRLADRADPSAADSRLARTADVHVLELVDGGSEQRVSTPLQPHPDGTLTTTFRVPPDARGKGWRMRVGASFAVAGDVPVTPTSTTFELPLKQPPPRRPWLLIAGAVALLLLAWRQWRLRRARFTARAQLNVLVAGAHVHNGELTLHDDDGREVDGSLEHFEQLNGRRRPRRMRIGVFTLRCAGGLLPGSRPRAVATAGGRPLVCGSFAAAGVAELGDYVAPVPGPGHREYEIGFELRGTWLFALDAYDPDDGADGQLVVIVANEGSADQGRYVLGQARTRLLAQDWDLLFDDDRS